VRVQRTENQQQFTPNLGGPFERAGVLVFAQLAVMDSGSVKANRREHVRLKRCAEREVATDAEAGRSEFTRLDARMLIQIIERRSTISVELGDRSRGGISETARPTFVVEWDRRSRRLDAVIDLGRGNYET